MKHIQFQQPESERIYPLGFQFALKQGKRSTKDCTIINYAITHNASGLIIKFEYIVIYDYLGQRLTETMCQTTIDIATNNGWRELPCTE